MATSLDELTIDRPIIESITDTFSVAAATVRIQITRVPSDNLTGGNAGYQVFRAQTPFGFSGLLGPEAGGFAQLSVTTLQPPEASVVATMTIANQPANVQCYYRVRACDNLSNPLVTSPLSNVAVCRFFQQRQQMVRTFPIDLYPNRNALKGILDVVQDADVSAGITWFEIRTAMMQAIEGIADEINQRITEQEWLELLCNPPTHFSKWFEYASLSLLAGTLSLPPDADKAKLVERFAKEAEQWRENFLTDPYWSAPGGLGASPSRYGIGRA